MTSRLITWVCLLFPITLWAQQPDTLNLETCYRLAKQNEPVLQRNPLLQRQLQWTISDLQARFMPQLSAHAQATYQSDVTSIPFRIPNQQVPQVPKDQYKATLDLDQLILDGGRVHKQMQVAAASSRLAQGQQDVEFHSLKEQLMDLYETMLVLDASQQALALKRQTLKQQIRRIQAAVTNGSGLSSQADEFRAASLELQQRIREVQANRRSTLQALSLLTGTRWPDSVQLKIPEVAGSLTDTAIQRPELRQFKLKDQLLDRQIDLAGKLNRPSLYGFVQGGYGRPGLNMLSSDFEWYYLAGLRLDWTLWDWGTRRRQQRSLQADRDLNDLDRQEFLLQTRQQLDRQQEAIRELQDQLSVDQKLVRLRKKIVLTAAAQLAQGVITPTEYLIELQDETEARITRQTHRIQLTFAQLKDHLLKSP